MKPAIAYYRVSTKRQGQSGLGLEAQQAAVAAYTQQAGYQVVSEYVEVETGKRADREQLRRALSHAKRAKAVLIVAKLDRLARNVAFTSALMESGVEFTCCDNPHANRLTIHILAAVAEDEARRISERTKAALAAAKARGTKLGSNRPEHWKGLEERRQAGLRVAHKRAAESHRKNADEAYEDLRPVMIAYRDTGMSLAQVAAKLNAEGYKTRRGKEWSKTQVARVLQRFESLSGAQ